LGLFYIDYAYAYAPAYGYELRDIKEEDCSYPTLEVEGHPKMEDQK
jgi:hypothetical protein